MNALRQILAPESRHYRRRGYQVFRKAFPSNQISAIADMARRLIPAYTGKLRRQDGNFAANEFFPGTQLVRNSPLHPNLPLPGDLEPLSSALHALVTSPALAERLALLDGAEPLYHPSDAPVFRRPDNRSSSRQLVGRYGAPRPCAHDLDTAPGPRPSIGRAERHSVAERQGRHRGRTRPARSRHARRTLCPLPSGASRPGCRASSPEAVLPLLRMGDFIVWASLTPHFTLPAQSFPAERLSLQVLIRPADNRWGDFLDQPYDRTSVELQRVTDRFSVRIVT